ncbi:MAG: Rsd/AlgQ family anti-sigma factor [Aliiglaciecola sp.]|uniref:sigma D regulator n=1 Tax=Aliiglaciecola sp. M165 TaxID=2593649 RepID=UPI0011812B8A|nr:sigma D regulator [Aliiglaciecola sp. M165]TRY33817.1 sigma D regulator [Aliiglaciecola sp. M165]
MLGQVETAKQKYAGIDQSVDTWLQERQQLLVQYCQLAGLPPFENRSGGLPSLESIRSFCETLVDYVSAGHFEVYGQLTADTKDFDHNNTINPIISETTEDALAFNDAYAEIGEQDQLASFDKSLSHLGQRLEERFALEDELLNAIKTQPSAL